MNLQYVIRICHIIHNKGTMSQWQIQVTIFLSGTDVTIECMGQGIILKSERNNPGITISLHVQFASTCVI